MKAGHLVPALRQQVELVEQLRAVEHLAELPGDPLCDRPLAHAQSIEDLQRALGVAQAARALAELGLAVDDHAGHAALAEIDRQRQPDRPAAHDHDRMARRPRPVLIGRAPVGTREAFLLCQAPAPRSSLPAALARSQAALSSARHISMSRSAVQIRGLSMPLASS